MAEENLDQPLLSDDDKENPQKSIDLNKLAEKLVALLLREIEVEGERTGR